MTTSTQQYPIGGYAPGGYLCKCSTCGNEFQGNREAFQCEPCAIKDKEFYEALTPEQRERFDMKSASIYKLFFEGIKKDEEIARLKEMWRGESMTAELLKSQNGILIKALEQIDDHVDNILFSDYKNESAKCIKSIATEALKQ